MVRLLSVEDVVFLNILVLNLIPGTRADKHEVLDRLKISKVLLAVDSCEGDLYDKAVVLLKGFVSEHAFASGNRRTAFVAMKYFLVNNNKKIKILDDPSNSRVMTGIREGYYSDKEIKEWIMYGTIREFRR